VTQDPRLATRRLYLEPLSLQQCTTYLLGAREGQPWAPDFPTDGDLRQAHILSHNPDRAVSVNNPWGPYTLIERVTQLCIGGIGFKGPPDSAGVVEIGYGICASRQNRGFMSEAVARLIELARDEGAFALGAETDAKNVASQRVLEKCGFARASQESGSIWWRLELFPSLP
jgi:RimJ/RimL family protein N-acetyltransferase